MALSKDRIFKVADGYIRSGKIEKGQIEIEAPEGLVNLNAR